MEKKAKTMKFFLKYLTSSFLTHINYELSRSDEILNNIDIGESKARVRIERIHKEIFEFFPDIKPIEFNFVHELHVNRLHKTSYYNSSFEGFDVIFWESIKDLLSSTKESREIYKEVSSNIWRKLDHEKFGLNMKSFIKSSSELREILHEMIIEFYKGDEQKIKEVWSIVYKQNIEHQNWIIDYFESLLIDAWKKSEDLLNNIFPIKITEELKRDKKVEPVRIHQASVLFTDFKGFTQLTEQMDSTQLVKELDICFKEFDAIVNHFSLEKIKTLGDGYMCAGGVPEENDTHIYAICLAGLAMVEKIKELSKTRAMACGGYWQVRIGIHTGELVAGVIGEHKFSYDIWGDTVNTASRMESSGIAGEVNISHELKEKIEKFFHVESRGSIPAKNKGKLKMYLLKGLKEEYQKEGLSSILKSLL